MAEHASVADRTHPCMAALVGVIVVLRNGAWPKVVGLRPVLIGHGIWLGIGRVEDRSRKILGHLVCILCAKQQ